jgi:hypothetical protein
MSDIFWARSVALSVSRDQKFTPQDASFIGMWGNPLQSVAIERNISKSTD